jgi:hypothetical protein
MFEALANKIVTGIMAFGMMLFTSTEGNKAEFSDIQTEILQDGLIISTQLINSFQNDFEQVFKSGKPVIIEFALELQQGNTSVHKDKFTHTVTYAPMQQNFKIELQEKEEIIFVNNYSEMLQRIAEVEYQYWGKLERQPLKISLQASLRKLQMSSQKKYNLMILWKYRNPTIEKTIGFQKDEI